MIVFQKRYSNRKRTALLLFHALGLACVLHPASAAQDASASRLPEFEVATIKPVDPSPGVMHMIGLNVYPGGRIRIQTFNLKSLICTAFNLSYWQVSGGEDWMNKAQYDVVAKAPEDASQPAFSLRHTNFQIDDPRLRQMLQALLIDRFQLKFHRATATGPVYLLVKSGRPIPLRTAKVRGADDPYGEGYGEVGWAERWGLYNASMDQLAQYADANILHRTVLDQTGMDGLFDYRSTVTQTVSSPESSGPTFQVLIEDSFKLFIEEIGLKLVPSTGPVETFVIDRAEPPSAN